MLSISISFLCIRACEFADVVFAVAGSCFPFMSPRICVHQPSLSAVDCGSSNCVLVRDVVEPEPLIVDNEALSAMW